MKPKYGVTFALDGITLMQALDPDWQIAHARERMMESFGEKLRLMATCLWDVNEFEGDSPLLNIKYFKRGVVLVPDRMRDYLFHWFDKCVISRTHKWRLQGFWIWLRRRTRPYIYARLKKLIRYELHNEQKAVEPIQSSILAQMFWLREQQLVPRAVIVHPEIRELLTAYPQTYQAPLIHPTAMWQDPEKSMLEAFEPELGFCGLRVIVNPNMKRWGAYVV